MDFDSLYENPAAQKKREMLERFKENPPNWSNLKPARPAKKPRAAGAPVKADYNERSVEWLKAQGYKVERVDHYDPILKRHFDLFGIFDYLALREGETVGVQITSKSNLSTRKKKILDGYGYKWVSAAGWKVLVLGWEKGANGRYGDPTEVWL